MHLQPRLECNGNHGPVHSKRPHCHYPFNGNANNASGNDNNGTVIGAVLATDRTNNANAAYAFANDGDRIDINHNGYPMGNEARTIAG